jgi:DNA-3-methyladenine glycosylase II
MKTVLIEKPRGFALRAAAEFYAGFTPGSGMAAAAMDGLTLAFRLERTFEAVAVALREERDVLVADYAGTDDGAAVSRQVGRMLGLDERADAWLALGLRDAVVGRLQSEFSGFFTAAKPSPYDAAAWGIISPRMSMAAAAKLKIAIAERHGDAVTLFGRVHHVFPSPKQLLAIDRFTGLPSRKLERLKAIAHAALVGRLDADRLRAMHVADALAELQLLPGVGPWTAGHILFRGAAMTDALPLTEPRILHGLAEAYGMESPSVEDLARVAEGWRPFRMWVCILLARHLARVGGWSQPGLSRERATLTKATRSRGPIRSRQE